MTCLLLLGLNVAPEVRANVHRLEHVKFIDDEMTRLLPMYVFVLGFVIFPIIVGFLCDVSSGYTMYYKVLQWRFLLGDSCMEISTWRFLHRDSCMEIAWRFFARAPSVLGVVTTHSITVHV